MSLSESKIKNIYFVKPSEVQNSKEGYSELFSNILRFCYGKDYPISSLDKSSIINEIGSEKQKTVFWAVNEKDKKERKFGTASVVDVSKLFGSGYAQICKSGSLGEKDSKYGYAYLIQEWQRNIEFAEIDSLVVSARNCLKRPIKEGCFIRDGIGARISFLKYLEFEQWGISPWYIMPDMFEGSYEVPDLLFRFRNLNENIDFLKTEKIGLYGKDEKLLLSRFIKLNYNKKPEFLDDPDDEKVLGWDLITTDFNKEKNPQFLAPSNNENKFESKLEILSSDNSASLVIFLPLIASTIKTQRLLKEDGWVLTGFIPGRIHKTFIEPYKGIWTKLKLKKPIIEPIYLDKKQKDSLSPKWYFKWVKETIKKLKG